MLMNLETLTWDLKTCAELDIPVEILPKIVPSSSKIGVISAGPLQNTVIGGILGDQQAALFGQMCYTEGSAKNTYGIRLFLSL